MYGTGNKTLPTWKDTLRTKNGATKVPWTKRERLIALNVIFAGMIGDKTSSRAKSQPKLDIIERCKLSWLISNQDNLVPNSYWVGFLEELKRDPNQEQLYDKVMQAVPSSTFGSMNSWPSVEATGGGKPPRASGET
jgi:hypothetical protein